MDVNVNLLRRKINCELVVFLRWTFAGVVSHCGAQVNPITLTEE